MALRKARFQGIMTNVSEKASLVPCAHSARIDYRFRPYRKVASLIPVSQADLSWNTHFQAGPVFRNRVTDPNLPYAQ